MATTFDRTIEQFDLIDRYSAKLDKMSQKTLIFGKHTDMVKKGLQSLERGMANTLKIGASAVGTLAATTLVVGKNAFDAAVKYEQLNTTLEAITGSADKASQKLDFAKKLAIPSTFTFNELAQAGTQLEAFGVPMEKALISISKLGAAFPNKQLEDFVNLYGRLASGDFPDLEALSGAGLSKLDFMQQGIKFDAQGSLISSTRDTMDALDRIISQKYGNILDKIAGTTAAKLATVRDKWDDIMRKVGNVLIKYAVPALDKLDKWLEKLSKNDSFEKWAIKAAVETLKFAASILEWLGHINIAVAGVAAAMGNFAGVLGAIASALFSYLKADQLLRHGSKALRALFDLGKPETGGAKSGDAAAMLDPLIQQASQFEYKDNPALKTLNDIEKHTKNTADNTRAAIDLRKYALGGGDIGAMGISPIDRYGRHAGGGRGGNATIQVEGRDKLAAALAEVAQQVYEQMRVRERLNGVVR